MHVRFTALRPAPVIPVDPFLRAWHQYVYRIGMTLLVDARNRATAERRRAALLDFADLLFYAPRLVHENRRHCP